jgi:nitrile hydratase
LTGHDDLPVAARARRLEERLIAAGLTSDDEMDEFLTRLCTLCSCYPVSLLGPSPGWYKSFAYRSRTVREPRAVLAEFGLELPGEVAITVWDSTSEARYMVLPVRPAGTEALAADELTALVTRNGLIGTALV